jgi:hypothetical protein
VITDEFPCESIDNDYRGLLGAYQMDNMEYPPDPEGQCDCVCHDGLGSHTEHECWCMETCEHGMAAWLCAHPIYHYPTDEMMNEGRYY